MAFEIKTITSKGSSLTILVDGPHSAAGQILDLLLNPKYSPESITVKQVDV